MIIYRYAQRDSVIMESALTYMYIIHTGAVLDRYIIAGGHMEGQWYTTTPFLLVWEHCFAHSETDTCLTFHWDKTTTLCLA